MSEIDLKFLAIAIPFIWGFIHLLIICIAALLTTDWEEEKRISEMYLENKREESGAKWRKI